MNVISNTCLGAYIMRDCLKIQYNNPFCWCIIDANSMYNLIKDFKFINFENWEIEKNNENIFSIIIDNKIKVKYVHYHYSKNDNTPRIYNVDVFYNKIWEYVVEKYISRSKRMQKNDVPIFIIGTSYTYDFYSKEELEKIIRIHTDSKIIVCNNKIHIENSPKNVIYYDTDIYQDNEKLSKEIYNLIISS